MFHIAPSIPETDSLAVLRTADFFLFIYYFFLSRVSTLTRDIDTANLSVCLSVCPSVTFRYQMKTA